jgi:hypothetical protein
MTHASSQVAKSALSARLDNWLALVTEPLAALAVVAEVVILLTGGHCQLNEASTS